MFKVNASSGRGEKITSSSYLCTGGVVVQSDSPAKGGSDEPLENGQLKASIP